MVPVEVDLVRHGETEANAAGILQGWGDSPLSARGARQARAAARRLNRRRYRLVASSHLRRAVTTAEHVGPVTPVAGLAEMNMGRWEGLAWEEVRRRFPDELAALRAGEPVAFGGGETMDEFISRIRAGLEEVTAMVPDGGRALVVAHGGVIQGLVRTIVGAAPGSLGRVVSAAITTVRWGGDDSAVLAYNDAWHLGGDHAARDPEGPEVWLVRHGETEANIGLRWQGRTDSNLTASGRAQAVELAASLPQPGAVYSSPAGRARATAAAVAQHHEIEAREHAGLAEMDFGTWEDLTTEEASRLDPSGWAEVYDAGVDAPRGGTGETFAGAAQRLEAAVGDLAQRHDGGPVVAVTHGGVLRALAARVCDLGFIERNALGLPSNASVTRVVMDDRLRLASYNTKPGAGSSTPPGAAPVSEENARS